MLLQRQTDGWGRQALSLCLYSYILTLFYYQIFRIHLFSISVYLFIFQLHFLLSLSLYLYNIIQNSQNSDFHNIVLIELQKGREHSNINKPLGISDTIVFKGTMSKGTKSERRSVAKRPNNASDQSLCLSMYTSISIGLSIQIQPFSKISILLIFIK